jgi:hypothetical protein
VFASYNACPNRTTRLGKQAQEQGFDHQWIGNVEIVVTDDVGEETATRQQHQQILHYLLVREEAERSREAK